MKKGLVLSLVIALMVSASSTSFASQKDSDIDGKTELVKKTDAIIKSNLTIEERTKKLQQAGWEIVDLDADDAGEITTMSAPGCGTVSNKMMKQFDQQAGIYKYLIQADWNYVCSTLDDTSEGAPDYIALAVVTNTNAAINQLAEYAQIWVKDSNGNGLDSTFGTVSGFFGGGATFTFKDQDREWPLANYGTQGSAWFYVKKPTNTGVSSYAIRSDYKHTWSTNSISLNSLTIGYPYSVSASWSTTNGLNSWNTADQDAAVFN